MSPYSRAARTCTMFVATCLISYSSFASDLVWVEASNAHAQTVLKVMAKYSPEGAGSLGVDGLDEQISDYEKRIYERSTADTEKALKELNKRFEKEESTPLCDKIMYRDALKNWGVDEDPEDLIERAAAGYMDIRNEMQALAPLVAAQKGVTDFTLTSK